MLGVRVCLALEDQQGDQFSKEEESSGNKVITAGQTIVGLPRHCKDFGLSSEWTVEPLEGFEQRNRQVAWRTTFGNGIGVRPGTTSPSEQYPRNAWASTVAFEFAPLCSRFIYPGELRFPSLSHMITPSPYPAVEIFSSRNPRSSDLPPPPPRPSRLHQIGRR